MKISKLTEKILLGSTVTIATANCSGCQDNGAVDPPPPPLNCSDIGAGQTLVAHASLADSLVTVNITTGVSANWKETPEFVDLSGFTLKSVSMLQFWEVEAELKLDSLTVTSGEFTLRGALKGPTNSCSVERRFTVTIDAGNVSISQRATSLPLGNRSAARIELVGKSGFDVKLRAKRPAPDTNVYWSVTGGSFESGGADEITWHLPRERGLYQAELLTDHGRDGLAVDTIVLEVL